MSPIPQATVLYRRILSPPKGGTYELLFEPWPSSILRLPLLYRQKILTRHALELGGKDAAYDVTITHVIGARVKCRVSQQNFYIGQQISSLASRVSEQARTIPET